MPSPLLRLRTVLAPLALIALAGASHPAGATSPGFNGKIAYTDLLDPNTPTQRRAVFVDKAQFTVPTVRGGFQSDNDSAPAWSPDGKQLAFVRRNGSTGEFGIWVIDEGGTGLHEVFDTGNALPDGSPGPLRGQAIDKLAWQDKDKILFVSGLLLYGLVPSTGQWGGGSNTIGSNVDPETQQLDAGANGTITTCLPGPAVCILSNSGPGGYQIPLGLTTVAVQDVRATSWWPAVNRLKVAASSAVFENGFTGEEILAVEFYANGHTANSLMQLTKSGLVQCTARNVATGVLFKKSAPQYFHSRPVPSPDGKSLLVQRVEQIPQPGIGDNDCGFTSKNGIYKTRAAAGSPFEAVVEGDHVGEAAWQPLPGALVVQVFDGHGDPLNGLRVELRDFTDPNLVIATPARHGEDGTYGFDPSPDLRPGDYMVRVTLVNEEWNAFDVRHAWPAASPAWVDRKLTLGSADVQTKFDFEFDSDEIVNASIDKTEDWGDLDDMAAIYYQTRRFVKWFRETLQPDTGPPVSMYTFASQGPIASDANPKGLIPPASSFYITTPHSIWMGTDDSQYKNRASPGDPFPTNGEWHEFSHHVYFTFVFPQFGLPCEGDNHGGYALPSSCDSLAEGFAEFLASQVEKNPDYAGLANLESPIKAWDLRTSRSRGLVSAEEFAAGALLWDVVDDGSDLEYGNALGADDVIRPVAYGDNVTLPLPQLWSILTATRPRTVFDLHEVLGNLPQFSALSQDLDGDGIPDISAMDALFLMHGFFRIDLGPVMPRETYAYPVASARNDGLPADADVGLTNHFRFDMGFILFPEVIPRDRIEEDAGANLAIRLLDASGRPLHGGEVDLGVVSPTLSQTIHRALHDDATVHLELPFYLKSLPESLPLPACDPALDLVVNVTTQATINGYASLDAPSFDSCSWFGALLQATGSTALTLTLNFPEDSTPPVTTPQTFSIGAPFASTTIQPGVQWTSAWSVGLSCADPVVGNFASGCWRTEYSLDGGAFIPYTDEFQLSQPGLHTLRYRSLDAAENTEATGTLQIGVVDPLNGANTPPVTTLSATPSGPANGTTTTGDWTVSLSCATPKTSNEPGVGCRSEYILDNHFPFTPYTGPFVIASPGAHRLIYHSIDLFGVSEPLHTATLTIASVDTTPPFTGATYLAEAQNILQPWEAMGAFTWQLVQCTDYGPADQLSSGCARTEYSLDGGPFLPWMSQLVVSSVGAHTFAFHSIDNAGNQEPDQRFDFEIIPPLDSDGDGILDFADNCSQAYNPDQRDTDGDRFGNRCDPDFNQNGTVDSNDASLLKSRLGKTADEAPNQDLDGNGVVDASDLKILTGMFRKPPGPAYGYTWADLSQY